MQIFTKKSEFICVYENFFVPLRAILKLLCVKKLKFLVF